MTVALDTNILAYAEGVNGRHMLGKAVSLIAALPETAVVLPVQVIGELFNVLVKKARRRPSDARAIVLSYCDVYSLAETSSSVMIDAAELSAANQMTIWDAVIVASAAEARCRLLLSEDLHDGFTWRGVTVTNPFAPRPHPALAALLEPPASR